MRALVFDGTTRLREIPAPEPRDDEARIRVLRAGVCSTDLEIARGYMGFRGVLGHEFVGVVEAAPVASLVGRRVTGEINVSCGRCEVCARGLGRHCPDRAVLGILGKDGCLAEHVTLPVDNLHPVPDGVPDAAAAFVEPLAAAFEILEQVHVGPADRVAVLGDGKLGLLCAMVLRETGCDLTLVGRHDRKLAIAAGLGVRTARPEDGGGERAHDVLIEATGTPAGFELALERLRPRGTLVLKSTFHGRPAIDTARVVIDEITVVGSRCGPFGPAVRALHHGRIDPSPLVDATYPLSEAVAAFERAAEPGVLKVVVACDS